MAPTFRSLLLEELGEWLPEDVLLPLASAQDASATPAEAPLGFADRGLFGLLPLGLTAQGLGAAAEAARQLPGLQTVEAARHSMFGLEKLARAHAAPEVLVRAAHGTCACALSLSLAAGKEPEVVQRAAGQLVSALVRLLTTAVKAGVPVEEAVRCLCGEAGVGPA